MEWHRYMAIFSYRNRSYSAHCIRLAEVEFVYCMVWKERKFQPDDMTDDMVGPRRFERRSQDPQSWRMDQATLWPHYQRFRSIQVHYTYISFLIRIAMKCTWDLLALKNKPVYPYQKYNNALVQLFPITSKLVYLDMPNNFNTMYKK